MSAVLQAHPPPRRPGLTLAGCQFGPCPTTDEASHVASSLIFHACRHQYPGGSRPVLLRLASRSAIGLPLNSGGSAPATNVSRPAQCLLALRPAWSLNCSCSPSHQSASVHVVASINRPGCYQPEPQLLRGVRTRQREAPYHGARRVRGWRASFRVRWYNPLRGSRHFRSGPQSGSHGRVSRPLLINPDVRISRIRLSDEIMNSPTEGRVSSSQGR